MLFSRNIFENKIQRGASETEGKGHYRLFLEDKGNYIHTRITKMKVRGLCRRVQTDLELTNLFGLISVSGRSATVFPCCRVVGGVP